LRSFQIASQPAVRSIWLNWATWLREGHRAAMVFLVQRPDCDTLSLASDIDPNYAEAFKTAKAAGVEAYAIGCDVRLDGIDAVKDVAIND
jgi:sugar fermentation stimulation protein A